MCLVLLSCWIGSYATFFRRFLHCFNRQFNGYLKTGGDLRSEGRGRFPDPKLHDAGAASRKFSQYLLMELKESLNDW